MRIYNDRLGRCDTQIVKLVMANTELNKEMDLLNKDVATLAAKVQQMETARDVVITEKEAAEEANLHLITEKAEME